MNKMSVCGTLLGALFASVALNCSAESGQGTGTTADDSSTAGGSSTSSASASSTSDSGEDGGASGVVATTAPLPFEGEALPGYTLITSPENDAGSGARAHLVDMEGAVVHQWSINGFPAKMLPGGDIIGCTGVNPQYYDCLRMEQRSWDDELIWSFDGLTVIDGVPAARQHHDFVRDGSPVGYFAPGQAYDEQGTTWALGMYDATDPELRDGVIVDDLIYEIDAEGQLGRILWRGLDHLDEFGFDQAAMKDLETDPATKLEFLHGNTLNRLGPNRWFEEGHAAFDPDHFLYSSRLANLAIIISHETGEILWRIGPDFEEGPEAPLGQFVGQHFLHVIPVGLPGAGNMLVLDNGGNSGYGGFGDDPNASRYRRNYSRVLEFNPITFQIVWEYSRQEEEGAFFSPLLGSVQRLLNGNTLITAGLGGWVFEVTPDREVVWEYRGPNDGTDSKKNWIYRGLRVPPEWLPAGKNEELGEYAQWSELLERTEK